MKINKEISHQYCSKNQESCCKSFKGMNRIVNHRIFLFFLKGMNRIVNYRIFFFSYKNEKKSKIKKKREVVIHGPSIFLP